MRVRHNANHESIRDTFHLCLIPYGHAQLIVLQKRSLKQVHIQVIYLENLESAGMTVKISRSHFTAGRGSSLILRPLILSTCMSMLCNLCMLS